MWKHNTEKNPVIPKDSVILWKETWTANPATLHFKGRHLLYYRGHGRTPTNPDGHDRLAVAEIMSVTGSEFNFRDLNEKNFIVDVGPKGTFDDADVLDPSAIEFHGKVMVYYSGVGTGPNSVGLAVSDDGEHFTKIGKVMEGRAPGAIVRDDKVYLLFQRDSGKGYLAFFWPYPMMVFISRMCRRSRYSTDRMECGTSTCPPAGSIEKAGSICCYTGGVRI